MEITHYTKSFLGKGGWRSEGPVSLKNLKELPPGIHLFAGKDPNSKKSALVLKVVRTTGEKDFSATYGKLLLASFKLFLHKNPEIKAIFKPGLGEMMRSGKLLNIPKLAVKPDIKRNMTQARNQARNMHIYLNPKHNPKHLPEGRPIRVIGPRRRPAHA